MMLDLSAPLGPRPSVLAGRREYARPVPGAGEQAAMIPPDEAQIWIASLRGPASVREPALAELHDLLLRAARFELGRRRGQLAHLQAGDVEDLAAQAADDALMAILAKIGRASCRERV